MSNEEDLEIGIPHLPIDDENGDKIRASDAANNDANFNEGSGINADTQPSPTTLIDSERIHDVADVAPSTGSVGQLPSDPNAAVRDNHRARKFKEQYFIADLLNTNHSGETNIGQLESIMVRAATSSSSAVTINGGRGEDTTRGAPPSVVPTNQDILEPAAVESSPLFADESFPVLTQLTDLDGLTRENVRPPMRAEDDATSPWSLENAGIEALSPMAELENPPQILEEHYDVESPSSYHYNIDARNHLNSPFGESSPLFADDPATRNMTAASPFSGLFTGLEEADHDIGTSLPPGAMIQSTIDSNLSYGESSPLFADDPATRIMNTSPFSGLFTGIEEADRDDVAPVPPGPMVQYITDSQAEVSTMIGGLVQSNDYYDGPPTPAAIENEFGGSSATRKMRGEVLEQVYDQDDGPNPFAMASAFENSNLVQKVRTQSASEPSNNFRQVTPMQPNGLNPPVPFNYSMFEDHQVQKQQGQRDDASISFPTPDEIETGAVPLSQTRTPADIRNRFILEDRRPPRMGVGAAASSDADIPSGVGDGVSNTVPARGVNQDDSILRIPEAYLVEWRDSENRDDGEIIIATNLEPPIPLWKQKRVVCFLFLFMLVVIAIVAGVTRSFNGTPEIITGVIAPPLSAPPSDSPSSSIAPTAVRSNSPSHTPSYTPSTMPTTVRSSSPSRSFAPSFSPTSCSKTLSTGKQTLDMPLDSPENLQVAIDRRNMVVVAKDTNLDYVYVVFYSLEDDQWVRKAAYSIEEYEHAFGYSVALSDNTALVGFQYADTSCKRAGLVYIYEQDGKGVWNKAQEPMIPEDGGRENEYFGESVDIDADLACVIAGDDFYIFRRDIGQQWWQIQRLDYGLFTHSCSVVGNTIAVRRYSGIGIFQFDEELSTSVSLKTTISPNTRIDAMSLSNNHLVYSTSQYDYQAEYSIGEEVFIYQRQDRNQPFILHQGLNSSEFDVNNRHVLALDEDILVISRHNKTHVFSEQNGVFKNSLTLNQQYESVQISGRSLIAADEEEVHAFVLDDCMQAVPTQTPSASSSPTKLPSHLPSTLPSTSISPTETCYWIDVTLDSVFITKTTWDVQRFNGVGDNIVVKTYTVTRGDRQSLRKESMCLEEGQYQFTIDGIYEHYNVTSYGALIVKGPEFGRKETTIFSLPLTQFSSAMP